MNWKQGGKTSNAGDGDRGKDRRAKRKRDENGDKVGKNERRRRKIEERPACKKRKRGRKQGTRRGKLNAGGGDRETSRRAKE
ncbi:MAG: hypothetical protein ACLR23_25265 [Clostridia bacterium]